MIAMRASVCRARTGTWSLGLANCCGTSTAGSARCEDAALSSTPRRLVTAERRDDDAADGSLRPQRLGEFIGQQQARSNLSGFIEAARAPRQALDPGLFVGRPGPGNSPARPVVGRRVGRNF